MAYRQKHRSHYTDDSFKDCLTRTIRMTRNGDLRMDSSSDGEREAHLELERIIQKYRQPANSDRSLEAGLIINCDRPFEAGLVHLLSPFEEHLGLMHERKLCFWLYKGVTCTEQTGVTYTEQTALGDIFDEYRCIIRLRFLEKMRSYTGESHCIICGNQSRLTHRG